MARIMSFAKTTTAIRRQTKTVTRRDGWEDLEVGERLQAVDKLPFVDPDYTVLAIIEVTDVRREPLKAIKREDRRCSTCKGTGEVSTPNQDHFCGYCHGNGVYNIECVREGLPKMTGAAFVRMFVSELGADPSDQITRIAFKYTEVEP